MPLDFAEREIMYAYCQTGDFLIFFMTEQSIDIDLGVQSLPGVAEVCQFSGAFGVVTARAHEWGQIEQTLQGLHPERDVVVLTPSQFKNSTGDFARGARLLIDAGSMNELMRLAPSFAELKKRAGRDTTVLFRVDNTRRQLDDLHRAFDEIQWLGRTLRIFDIGTVDREQEG